MTVAATPSLRAQDPSDSAGQATGTVWRLEGLRKGFCVQLLLDPARLARDLPREVRLLRADGVADLHPALRRVVANQPEYAGWSPSALCLYYLSRVDAGSVQVSDQDPAKAPVLCVWTVAAVGPADGLPNLALEILANDGDLRKQGRKAALDIERLRSAIGEVPREAGPPRPGETRYQVRLGKTILTWDGRPAEDTTRAPGALSSSWAAAGRRGRWVSGRLTLVPTASTPMVGSLRIEGKDAVAAALQASPIRFVGPAFHGGDGELRLAQGP